MKRLIKHTAKLTKTCLALMLATLVMMTVLTPTAGASNGSWMSLDVETDLTDKNVITEQEKHETLVIEKETREGNVLVAAKKRKKMAKKK